MIANVAKEKGTMIAGANLLQLSIENSRFLNHTSLVLDGENEIYNPYNEKGISGISCNFC